MNGATRLTYSTVVLETSPIHARPIAMSVRPTPMSSPPPMRSESAPATGATNIGASVQGRTARPASSGE